MRKELALTTGLLGLVSSMSVRCATEASAGTVGATLKGSATDQLVKNPLYNSHAYRIQR